MKTMYDCRSNRMDLRKKFEMRSWQDESFYYYFITIIHDYYYHDKVIKANRVPIKKKRTFRLCDRCIDFYLRNQTRIQNFTLSTELLQVFKKINIYFDASETNRY